MTPSAMRKPARYGVGGALVACLLWAGCVAPDTGPLERGGTLPFRRVAVVEFADHSGYSLYGPILSRALREGLARGTAGANIVYVPLTEAPDLAGAITGGTIPFDSLMLLRRKYRADAMVLGVLDDLNPYGELSVHVTLKVIDTGSGRVAPYSLSRSWDTASASVRRDIDRYYQENRGRSEDWFRLGPNLFRRSPRHFLGYVADRIADDMVARL